LFGFCLPPALTTATPAARGEFQETDIKIFLEKVSQERLSKRQLCFIGPPYL
jgi:hypothetical protein